MARLAWPCKTLITMQQNGSAAGLLLALWGRGCRARNGSSGASRPFPPSPKCRLADKLSFHAQTGKDSALVVYEPVSGQTLVVNRDLLATRVAAEVAFVDVGGSAPALVRQIAVGFAAYLTDVPLPDSRPAILVLLAPFGHLLPTSFVCLSLASLATIPSRPYTTRWIPPRLPRGILPLTRERREELSRRGGADCHRCRLDWAGRDEVSSPLRPPSDSVHLESGTGSGCWPSRTQLDSRRRSDLTQH